MKNEVIDGSPLVSIKVTLRLSSAKRRNAKMPLMDVLMDHFMVETP